MANVPGLRRYVVNHSLLNPAGATHACDGIAELWFESMESFQAAIASSAGQAALADQANYLDVDRTHLLFVEENVVF